MPPTVSLRARQGVPAPTEDSASYVLLGLSSPQAGRLIAHHARWQPYQPLEAVQRRTVCARRASRGPTGGFAQAALLVNTRIQAGRTRARYAWRANTVRRSQQYPRVRALSVQQEDTRSRVVLCRTASACCVPLIRRHQRAAAQSQRANAIPASRGPMAGSARSAQPVATKTGWATVPARPVSPCLTPSPHHSSARAMLVVRGRISGRVCSVQRDPTRRREEAYPAQHVPPSQTRQPAAPHRCNVYVILEPQAPTVASRVLSASQASTSPWSEPLPVRHVRRA